MSLDETLKKVLGDDIYKEKGKELKQELAKEVIPKTEFNDKLETIKGLESEKRLLLEEKVQLEKSVEESQNAGKSDIEKLSLNLKKLEEKLSQESELRVKAEQTLNDEKTANSLKSKLKDAKMKDKYINKYWNDFKDVPEDNLEDKLKEFAENNKELFGEEKIVGKAPEGEFKDNKSTFYTKEQVAAMSQSDVTANIDKINDSMTKW